MANWYLHDPGYNNSKRWKNVFITDQPEISEQLKDSSLRYPGKEAVYIVIRVNKDTEAQDIAFAELLRSMPEMWEQLYPDKDFPAKTPPLWAMVL